MRVSLTVQRIGVVVGFLILWELIAGGVSVSYAIIGAVVGEFIGATRGLGFQMMNAEGLLDTDRLYSTLVILSAVAVLLIELAKWVEDRTLKWRPAVTF